MTLEVLEVILAYSESCSALAWSLDGQSLLSASNCTICLWTLPGLEAQLVLSKHTDAVTSVTWFPDSLHFASAGFDRCICLWKTDGNLLHKWELTCRIQDLAATKDGSKLLVVDSDKGVKVFDVASRNVLMSLPESDAVTSICVSRLRDELLVNVAQHVSALQEGPSVRLWDLTSRRVLQHVRRAKLTQVDVLHAAPPWHSLRPMPVLWMVLGTTFYILRVVPGIASFGRSRWQEKVDAGMLTARSGGPFSEVSESFAIVLSFIYVSLTFLSLRRMERHVPVTNFIFECVAVHNVTQCCYNLYCFIMLVELGHQQNYRIWGNDLDMSEQSHALGYLMWLQYHCRQLQLIETGFMILQKKFKGASFLHVYLRVLNLWGWFIACRCVCSAEAYVPALVSSACQSVIYGIYSSLSLLPAGDEHRASQVRFRASWVFRLQIAQYLICAMHSLAAATWGHFPWRLAWLHLFVIANGLILYTEWFSTVTSIEDRETSPRTTPRVVFSFDSCGWLFVYHFGVGAWLSGHLGLERQGDEIPQEVAFSGSSGGSLIACVLACGQKVRDVFDFIVEQQPLCRRNPTEMFPAVERALRHFQFEGAYRRANGRMRVLLTRITRTPPFVQGEVIDQFVDNETTIQALCASCHVPLFAGLLPRQISGRYYYDGLVWPDRLLVPWRGAPGDHVIRISACAHPLADLE
eukprot:symbB.v1.2.008371.t1/scaffold521.1/size192847/3